jgi:hypothetical protein
MPSRRQEEVPRMSPDGGRLSERELRILEELERELEGSGDRFVRGARSPFESSGRFLVAAVLVTAGAAVAVAVFTVSLVAAVVALAVMGAGIGMGAGPVTRRVSNRVAAYRGRMRGDVPS